ncbi:putative transporter small subunit [Oceanisphaera pacifica]|nr:putative transporter small subunit [Oceanisphaera pacifica]
MSEFILGSYILVWPALTLLVLWVICRAVWKDIKAAKKEKRGLV